MCSNHYGSINGPLRTALSLVLLARPWTLGFSLMPGLLGVMSDETVSVCSLLRLLAILAIGHFVGYAANDLFHYSIDRTNPERARRPLVSGAVSRERVRQLLVVAVMFSLVILPPRVAHAWLNYYIVLTSLGLVTIYNWYGKRRNASPFLADAALATACGLSPILGATISGHVITRWIVFLGVYYFTFIALINGVHGALRDLEHEIKQEVRTAALVLGARAQDGVLILSKNICFYCTMLHGLLCVQVLWELFDPRLVKASWRLMAAVSTLLAGVVIFSSCSLYVAWWYSGRNKQVAAAFGTMHMILVFVAPWTLFITFGAPWRTVAVIMAGVCPLACHSWFRSVAPMAVGSCMPRRQRKLAEG